MSDMGSLVANNDAPDFNQKMQKQHLINISNGLNMNCYEYAVSGTTKPDAGIANPGNTKTLEYWMYQDAPTEGIFQKILDDGLQFAGKDELPKKPGFYAVALFINKDNDYHFIRQNRDGTWSESPGTNQPLDYFRDEAGKISTKNPHEVGNYGTYQFEGYFLVPKGGIDVGSDVKLDEMAKTMTLLDIVTKIVDTAAIAPRSPETKEKVEQGENPRVDIYRGLYNSIRSMENKQMAEKLLNPTFRACIIETGYTPAGIKAQLLPVQGQSTENQVEK